MYITATPNALFTLSDTSGYNQDMNGNVLFVAMAATNTAFRGVAAIPSAPGPSPTGAVSRKTHGGAGDFDVNLTLSGSAGIECRSGGASNNYQVLITFASAVTFNSASITAGGLSEQQQRQRNEHRNGQPHWRNERANDHGHVVAVNNGTSTGNVSVPMGVLVG